jgi:hypothetical protein
MDWLRKIIWGFVWPYVLKIVLKFTTGIKWDAARAWVQANVSLWIPGTWFDAPATAFALNCINVAEQCLSESLISKLVQLAVDGKWNEVLETFWKAIVETLSPETQTEGMNVEQLEKVAYQSFCEKCDSGAFTKQPERLDKSPL